MGRSGLVSKEFNATEFINQNDDTFRAVWQAYPCIICFPCPSLTIVCNARFFKLALLNLLLRNVLVECFISEFASIRLCVNLFTT